MAAGGLVLQSSRERQESSTERAWAEAIFKVSRDGSSLCNVGLQRTKIGQVVKSMLAGAGLKQLDEQIM